MKGYLNKIDHLNRVDHNLHIYEGCLSLPNAEFSFPRYHKIKVKYFDESGSIIKETLEKFHAQIFQHELDHLLGKTIAHRCLDSKDKKTGGTIIPTGFNLGNEKDFLINVHALEDKYKALGEFLRDQL